MQIKKFVAIAVFLYPFLLYAAEPTEDTQEDSAPKVSLLRVDNLPVDRLHTVMSFLDRRSLGRLGCVNNRFYQITGDNDFWAAYLASDKIIPLLGRAWDKYPSDVLSYKFYFAAIHLLQNHLAREKEAIEIYLKSAILSDSVFSNHCLGLFYEMINQQERAYGVFRRAGELGDELLQRQTVSALYEGKLGQDKRSKEERYQELLSFAESGWISAQDKVANTLYEGKLGQDKRPEQERYQELISLAERGWVSCQNKVEDALYEGKLGQDKRPEEERYQELLSFAKSGWITAQDKIVLALYYDKHYGKLGRDKAPEQERYQELAALAERGWILAQVKIADALYNGKLDQNKRPEEERYQELISLAERGWISSQNKVEDALYEGKLGQDKRPEEERYQELISLAERGWISSKSKVVYALLGSLGQDKRPEEERYQELLSFAKSGWITAQDKVANTLYEGKLGQDKRSEEERYHELISLAERGWVSFQNKVEDAHIYNMLDGKESSAVRYYNNCSPERYNNGYNYYMGLSRTDGKSRTTPPSYFKPLSCTQIRAYLHLIQALTKQKMDSTIGSNGMA